MSTQPEVRSAGVTAAATVAVLGSFSTLIIWGWFFREALNTRIEESGKNFYQAFPLITLVLATVPPILVAAGLRISVGVFQLKEWARKAMIIWAVAGLASALAFVAFRPYETFVFPEEFVGEMTSAKQLFSISYVLFILPMSVWWLILFTRRGTRLQFQSAVRAGD